LTISVSDKSYWRNMRAH